ncbi:MAG: hypothetical protein FJ276_11395 [Planctomycetes bacterium]|nr:hypothetical protein [Planctomycetota bacterium]
MTSAGAETCKLEAKRVDAGSMVGQVPLGYFVQATRPQSIFMQIGGQPGMIGGPRQDGSTPEFSKVITKELAKYEAEHPFRGVVKLGSRHYGFVLDTAPKSDAEKKEADGKDAEGKDANAQQKTEGVAANALRQLLGQPPTRAAAQRPIAFTRLYFDVNGNGDLTDEKVIEANAAPNANFMSNHASFPAVEVEIDLNGTKFTYAFTMNVYAYVNPSYSYANVSLMAATYLEGEMAIADKKYRIAVVDYNSNGRFDDVSGIDNNVSYGDGSVYPSIGDMLFLIDPEASPNTVMNPYDPTTNDIQHYVGKLVNHGGRFFDLSIAPSGDKLTLEPSSTAVGFVTNSNKGYQAIMYGEKGFLKIAGDDLGKASLPEGEWRLAAYSIRRTGEPAKEQKPDSTMLGTLARAVGGSSSDAARAAYSMVSARGQRDCPPVVVRKDETVELPFGAPFRPVVTARYPAGEKTAALSMTLFGAGGEVCSSLMVNGGRPAKPTFKITTEDGTEVASGAFEYG